MKERIIFFIDDENLFPNFWIFKKFNRKYRRYIIQKIVPKIVKKYKNKNIKIISDCIIDFQIRDKIKSKAKFVQFSDYVNKYISPTIRVTKFIDKTFESKLFKKYCIYNSYNLATIMAGQMKFRFINDLDYLDIINDIIKKEKPTKILVLNKKNRMGKIVSLFKNKIKIKEMVPKIILKKGHFINYLIKKYSLFARFHKIPFVKRREFLKTNSNLRVDEKKESVLILGFDQTYYERLENIVKELKKDGNFQVVSLTTDTKIQEKLEKNKVKYISFGDFLNKKDIKEIKKAKKILMNKWERLKEDKRIHDLFVYKEIPLWNFVKKDIKYLFLNQFLWQLYYIKAVENLTKNINVKAMVSIDDFIPICRSVFFVGKSKNIPSLTVQPGILAATGGFCYVPIMSDKFAAWGKITKKEMVRWGADPKKIVITGNPRFVKPEKKKIEKLYGKLGLRNDKPIILLATECLEEYGKVFSEKEKIIYLKNLCDIFKKLPEYQIIIKLHPREELSFYRTVLPKIGFKNYLLLKEVNFNDLLNMCDVLITGYSTVVCDALIIGKQVLIPNFLGRDEVVPYTKSGSAFKITNKKQILDILKSKDVTKISTKMKKNRKKFISDCFYKADYREPERIVDLIKNMIKENI